MRFLVALTLLFLLPSSLTLAQRPTAPQLFPESTFAYLRVDDASDMIVKWKETGMGRLLTDPEVAPLIQEMYGSLVKSGEGMKFEERLGMSVDELLKIFNGEAAIALWPGPQDSPPTVAFMIEAKGTIDQLHGLLDKALTQNNVHGRVKKVVDGIELTDCVPSADPNSGFAYFIHQEVLVGSNSREELELLAKAWGGKASDHKPLSAKSSFLEILTRCAGIQGERPHVSFYVDPMAMAKELSKSNPGAPVIFAMLPPLGVDGIKGIGGSFIFAPNDFDSISHFHLLLSSPRRVLLSAIRPKEGPVDPETWVSEDVASYLTVNWQTQPTISAIAELVDTFQGPDFFETNVIKQASSQLSLDFRKEILDQIDDRITTTSYFVRPLRINSQSSVYAVKLKNPSKFESETLPKLVAVARKSGKWEEISHGTHQIFHFPQQQQENTPRIPDPAVTVLDGQFLASDSLQALQQACDTYDAGTNLLLESIEYKLIKQRITAQTKGLKLCGLTISRPEEMLRTFYDMAADPKNKERLGEMAGNNPVLNALYNTLTKHKLPPFEVIQKHMTPEGGFISEDDSGLHMTSFGIRRTSSSGSSSK